ncbi:MAG TPA: NF041680 family putative transposase [Ktedonobacteraceae bacterium]
MNFNRLKQIRQQLYASFERGADALFNLGDALLSESQAQSLPELSLSPLFERQWPSVYEALEDGRINVEQVRALWMSVLLAERAENELLWMAVDSSNLARPTAPTSAARTIIHVPNLPLVEKPISVGWTFSTVVLVPEQASSWTPILDQERISSEQTAIEVAIAQLRALKPLFGNRRVIILADRWYGTPEFLRACQELGYSVLIRLKSNRKLYRVPVRRHKRGAPPKDGPLFQGKRPETHGLADEVWSEEPPEGRRVQISRWNHLHFQQDRALDLSVIRVEREAATGTKRDPRVSWFVMLDAIVPLPQIALQYRRRFSQEHNYRFLKQELLWTRVHVRTPAQFERWSWLVALVFNQLYLARELGQALHRPWERTDRPVTPQQVRRVMPAILLQVGTPACPCQPRGKSPGRAKGFRPKPAARFPVVRKTLKEPLKASG